MALRDTIKRGFEGLKALRTKAGQKKFAEEAKTRFKGDIKAGGIRIGKSVLPFSIGMITPAQKAASVWTHATEKTGNAMRHLVYNQQTGDLKVMGLGREGAKRAGQFILKHLPKFIR